MPGHPVGEHGFAPVDEGLPLVVFTDIQDRQIPHRRQIQRFMEPALARRTVAEEADHDAVTPKHRA
jgi:hypothetical protein